MLAGGGGGVLRQVRAGDQFIASEAGDGQGQHGQARRLKNEALIQACLLLS